MNQTFYNRFGTPYKVIKYIDGSHVIVEFQDEYKTKVTTVLDAATNSHSVRNPYDKSIFGIGYLGVGKYTVTMGDTKKTNSRIYNCWKDMIERCYSDKYSENWKAYHGICTVDEEWYNYQNFAKWYEENEYECAGRLHLDKDILVPGNKVYSPETCLLVPQRINLIFMTHPRKHDADLPTGISRSIYKDGTCKYKASYNTKWLGTFPTLDDAINKYAAEKSKHIKMVAEEYRNIVPDKVYSALLKW